MNKRVCVVGGAGYIGSHTCKALAAAGFTSFVVDDLSIGHADAARWGEFFQLDIRETDRLSALLREQQPAAIIHFAHKAYVAESMAAPLIYYENNVAGTLSLVQAAKAVGIAALVFSSSCAIYGIPPALPVSEAMIPQPINTYGETKLVCERMLHWAQRDGGPRHVSLRYFNAAGADPDGELSERHDPETHLIPLTLRAAAGTGAPLRVLGDDYPTPDGTAIRDYTHVTDLAEAHIAALRYLLDGGESCSLNLAGGQGYSVREIIQVVERVTGRPVPHSMAPRRPGDPPALIADCSRAQAMLGWQPRYSDIETMVRTAWAVESRRNDIRR